MAKYGAVTFTGASETDYTFTSYARDTDFNAVGAVYFMTKRGANPAGGYSHTPIYVGQTGDLSVRPLNHHRKECCDWKEANCVCVLPESSRQTRLVIESDLREAYDPPCNRE